MNLCVNARDAVPDGGTITLSAQNVTLDEAYMRMHLEARPIGYVVLKVEDTGTGMAPGVSEKIFDPFFTTKEMGKGTGQNSRRGGRHGGACPIRGTEI
jgi:two-component system cell cycle sensor histidine kinase/response regulator CckA